MPRPRLSYPPPMAAPQFISPPAPAPALVAPASVTMAQDSDYLQYSDPVIDDFQYNQQQILSVDSNNCSQYEEQTYQQQSYGQTVCPALQRVQVQPSPVRLHQPQDTFQQMVSYNQPEAQVELQQQQVQQHQQCQFQPQRLAIEPSPAPLPIVHRQQQPQQLISIENPVVPAAISLSETQQEQHQSYMVQAPAVSVASSAPVLRHQQQHHQAIALPQQEQLLQIVEQEQEQPIDNTQQQIQIVIANPDAPNGAVGRSTPKLGETVNLNLIVDDVQNNITVKQEESLDKDISALASGINLKLNEDSPDDEDVGDFLEVGGSVNTDAADEDRNQNKVRRLSDDDVLNLPIQYLKMEDLAHRKKLPHC